MKQHHDKRRKIEEDIYLESICSDAEKDDGKGGDEMSEENEDLNNTIHSSQCLANPEITDGNFLIGNNGSKADHSIFGEGISGKEKTEFFFQDESVDDSYSAWVARRLDAEWNNNKNKQCALFDEEGFISNGILESKRSTEQTDLLVSLHTRSPETGQVARETTNSLTICGAFDDNIKENDTDIGNSYAFSMTLPTTTFDRELLYGRADRKLRLTSWSGAITYLNPRDSYSGQSYEDKKHIELPATRKVFNILYLLLLSV